jgi:3-hydroxybutyryl-CoA dehydratase
MTLSHASLKIGAVFSFRKTMTVAEQAMFTGISGNLGGLYVDAVRARKAGAANMVAFELAVGGLATTCLSQLGGPTRRIGSIALTFAAPVIVGDSVEAKAEIVSVDGDNAVCRITCALCASGETVVAGTATLVPFERQGLNHV